MTPTKKPITDTTPGISANIQQFLTTELHDEDHLSTQSCLTQETGFFSDYTFPISAVEAEIDEEHFIDIDTIYTTDSEDEYQDFQDFKENNTAALFSNSEQNEEISLTISDCKTSKSSISSTPGFTDTELPTWTTMNEGSVFNNSDPSIKYPLSAIVAEKDEQIESQ